MNTQNDERANMALIERQFLALHEAQVNEYQEQARLLQEKMARHQERQRADEKETRAMLKNAGVDVDLLDRRGQRDRDELKAYLEKVRPPLVERPSRRIADFKERSLGIGSVQGPGQQIITPYGASGIAVNRGELAGNKGDFDGPWIFPADPGQVKIRRGESGSGWGCGAWGEVLPPKITYWFFFVPNVTSLWNLTMAITFHGYYIVYADDGFFDCKYARVNTDVTMNAFQYYWAGPKDFSLIYRDGDNIDETGNYDATQYLSYPVPLKAGDLVWVTVDICVDAVAIGDGSHAEMNFSDGNANYLEGQYLAAWPIAG